MVNKFQAFIYEKSLFTENVPILLAISGGIDSVVMADLFAKANMKFAIAHCNFRLRGKASDADELLVKQLAEQHGVQFFVKSFETTQYAALHQISIEMAARQLRYHWFETLLDQHEYQFVATAHHKNDIIETLILNLSRGTGIAGLHGILSKKGNIIRPLLFADRRQIEAYAEENHLVWREDKSNHDEKHRRNLVRKKIIPVMEQVNPNLLQTLELSLERISGAEEIFKETVKVMQKVCVRQDETDVYLNIEALKQQVGMKVILHELIRAYGFKYQQSREIAEIILRTDQNRIVGKVFDSPTHRLNIDRNDLVISPILSSTPDSYFISEKEHSFQTEELKFTLRVLNAFEYSILPLPNVAALDHEQLKFPLELRNWMEGDFFYPLGMNRKKKLSDFMIDLKIPLNLKKRVKVLTSGEDIVWVIGYRIDHRFRVTNDTRQVYEVTMLV